MLFKCSGEQTLVIHESYVKGLILERLVDLDKDICAAEG